MGTSRANPTIIAGALTPTTHTQDTTNLHAAGRGFGLKSCCWDDVVVVDQRASFELLGSDALEQSAVVANCAMNRERQLSGVNSYTRELGFNPLDVLAAGPVGADRAEPLAAAGWLDLCCGTGRALIQAAGELRLAGLTERTVLVGVDLVDAFDPVPAPPLNLELICASVANWAPTRTFNLITCLHGLHYVGDKLAVLTRAAGWLTPTGRLVADLDLSSIRLADGRPVGQRLTARLRAAGFSYDSRRRRISCTGRRDARLPYSYLGADDRAGANYTGQPAVHSHYAEDH
ncbi:class I SAM-dependent methyltransferase [Micromonospora sp. NPDC051006]|uniref:class I SAM-dependent methyltransferase n=1 Tax=Micromonospora sp. NPDC051006 TaxID=3364283 RepID=UPI00378A2A45